MVNIKDIIRPRSLYIVAVCLICSAIFTGLASRQYGRVLAEGLPLIGLVLFLVSQSVSVIKKTYFYFWSRQFQQV